MKGLQDLYTVVLSKFHQSSLFTFTQQYTTLHPCTHHQLFSYSPVKKVYASKNQNVQQRFFPVQLRLRLRLWFFLCERLHSHQLQNQLPGTTITITKSMNSRLTRSRATTTALATTAPAPPIPTPTTTPTRESLSQALILASY